MADTLASINRAANEFRRAGGRRLPEEIKHRAVGLLVSHSAGEVARAVRVSSSRVVEGWQKKLERPPSSEQLGAQEEEDRHGVKQQRVTFVEVANLTPGEETHGIVEVELECGRQRRLRLRGRLGNAQLRALVMATLEGTGGCCS